MTHCLLRTFAGNHTNSEQRQTVTSAPAALSSGARVNQEHARNQPAPQVNVPEEKGHTDQQSGTDRLGLLPGVLSNVN